MEFCDRGRIKNWTLTLLAVFFLCGCEWNQGPEELDRLVKEDPAFKQMILQRNQEYQKIRLIQEDLLKQKAAVDAQIEKAREKYDIYAKTQNQKIEKCHAVIDASRAKLHREIQVGEEQIESKQGELEGYHKTLEDVQRVLSQSKTIALSTQEKKKWEERVLMLNEKIRPLSEEIQDLKLGTRLKKKKIGYLN